MSTPRPVHKPSRQALAFAASALIAWALIVLALHLRHAGVWWPWI
jgi:hypothetical protein